MNMILENKVIASLFSTNADNYEIMMGKLRFSAPCLQVAAGNIRRAVYFAFLIVLFFKSSFQQQQPLNSSTELTALLDLRSSLGLRSRDWPRKADPCLIWNGISCRNGRVIGINISGFRRTRIGSQNPQFAVDSLANLTLLQSFNASKFLLPGEIPDWFGLRLRSMQVLDLRFCSLVGAIPSSLANSTHRLYLSNNGLTGSIMASLGQLRHLSVLDLANNLLIGSIPFSLTLLRNLTRLDLSSNRLSGIIPSGIGTLSNLQFLNFSSNSLSSSLPAELGDLENLADLDLSFNYFSGSVPEDFSCLRNLKRMDLGNNLIGGSLSENVFANLTNLQFLVLKNNAFIGFVPNLLWSLPDLLLLDISGNNFTGNLTSYSLNLTTTSATLNMSNNLFYGSLAPLLQRFKVVDLSRNYFEGKVPVYLSTNECLLQNNCLQNLINQRAFVECSSFYSERGLNFDNFGQTNSTIFPAAKTSTKNNNKMIVLVTIFGGLALIVLIALLLLLLLRKHRIGTSTQRDVGVRQVTSAGDEALPGVSINFLNLGDSFTYQQILEATNGFSDSNLIKHGHSGDLFNGVLENGTKVVVKRVDLQLVKKETYLLELDLFSKVLNSRLVPLLGHCLENENEKFLVYKHMLNGDLSNALRKQADGNDENVHHLDWIKRMKIALGTAEGLSFLHNECIPPLVHRDVQASSILLDDKFEVRLGSLSELGTQEGGTHQNMITRLMRLPQSTEQGSSGSLMSACSYDVYCLGKVLLELVTGKVGISSLGNDQTKEWLDQILPYISIYDKELVTKIVDPSLILDEDFLEEVWAIAVVAKSCLNPKPSRRPLMRYVLKAVENPVKVVREESDSSARLRTASSRGSWNFSLFGSWRHSFSEMTIVPASRQAGASFKRSGTLGSQGSAQNNGGSSQRRQSKEVFPEPSGEHELARSDKRY